MGLAERLRLAVAGVDDPKERQKRIQEAMEEWKARTAQKKLIDTAHRHNSDQWVELPEDARHHG